MARKNSQIFATGTMRTGGSLVQNLLSVHSEVLMFAGFVSFFRFYYKQYEPLTPENVERMIHHLRIRLKCRRDFDLDAELIIGNILKRAGKLSSLLSGNNELFGRQNRQAKLGRVCNVGLEAESRLSRDVSKCKGSAYLSGYTSDCLIFWRMTNMPDNLYLQAIFNWIDSVNHIKRVFEYLPKNQYYVLKFEEIHSNPESKIKELCEFLEIPFENAMIEPERWDSLFDKNFVDANISSYSKKKVYGFDPSRSKRWKNEIS